MPEDAPNRPAADQPSCELEKGLKALQEGGQEPQAYAHLRAAAEQGQATGQYVLGMLCLLGKVAPRDPVEAARWLKLAAEQGHAGAQYELAERFFWGEGTPKDLPAAARWYRGAAGQGHSTAILQLAVMLKDGLGVERDLDEAARLARHPVLRTNIEAQSLSSELEALLRSRGDGPQPPEQPFGDLETAPAA